MSLDKNKVINGDCIEEMKKLPKNSVDSIVTDPPYGLAFMGKSWDDFSPMEFQEFSQKWGREALRVLKPGGYLLAFCGTRTYHRMVVAIEDAGFEIRDMIDWVYGSGFPKSHDISKAIDKHFDKEDEREVVGQREQTGSRLTGEEYESLDYGIYSGNRDITAPATPEAEEWEGWGTALKPAHEPIVVAQKPRDGTYAENVLEYGVGGLNIDGCRIGTEKRTFQSSRYSDHKSGEFAVADTDEKNMSPEKEVEGRFPANLVLDPESADMLDRQSGHLESGNLNQSHKRGCGRNFGGGGIIKKDYGGDEGGASRFFYSAKAQKSERNAGLKELKENKDKKVKNDIATLKPINLMRWLCRLVTPEDGVVLDPFGGSGTTGCAAVVEGFDYLLIEKRVRFAKTIAPKRIEYWSNENNWSKLKKHKELPDPSNKKIKKLVEWADDESEK